MRFLTLLCIILMAMLLSAMFLSCDKSNDLITDVPASKPASTSSDNSITSITGLWTGQYYAMEKSVPVYISFLVKEEGKLDVMNTFKKQTGTGEWTLKGNNFEASCTLLPQNQTYFFKGEVNSSLNQISGTWETADKNTIHGAWNMSK